MPRINIPSIGSHIEVEHDWFAVISETYRNYKFGAVLDPNLRNYSPPKLREYCFEAGTVFKVGKMEMNLADGSDSWRILLHIVKSPDRRLISKSKGGTNSGPMTVYIPIEVFNTLFASIHDQKAE